MEDDSMKEECFNGIVMMSCRPQYDYVEIDGSSYSKLKDYYIHLDLKISRQI